MAATRKKTDKKFTYTFIDKAVGDQIEVTFTGVVRMDKQYLPDFLGHIGEAANEWEGRLLSLEGREL